MSLVSRLWAVSLLKSCDFVKRSARQLLLRVTRGHPGFLYPWSGNLTSSPPLAGSLPTSGLGTEELAEIILIFFP